MADIDDLINYSMNQQPTRFASTFDDIMGQKATAAIDDMRISVAQNMFAAEEDDVDADDDFDLDIDDEDLEDVDWEEDEDEEELDDEDLEGFEDDGEDA
jgi:hypothetical protein